jgi:DNA recombination protein RmuC
MEIALAVLAGLIAGCGLTWLLTRSHTAFLRERQRSLEAENTRLSGELTAEQSERVRFETSLEMERQAAEEKIALIAESGENLRNAFRALSAEALKSSAEQFLGLARSEFERLREGAKGDLEKREQAVENLVKPLAENLSKFDAQVREIENRRSETYGTLAGQVRALSETTVKLADALRRPEIRGRWGEIQLRNVVELAGMQEYCDFFEQETSQTESGALRPDMVVKLPGGRSIAVDAKAPINAYVESLDAPTEGEREERLTAFARNVKAQVKNLGGKEYWKQFTDSPDLVVLFLPGEVFYNAALRADPSLIEEGIKNRVLLAAPTTLIMLLRVAFLGWREERLAENAERISALGREMYDRLAKLADYFNDLGKSLNRSVDAYNDLTRSLEARVFVSGRKFKELGVGSDREIAQVEPLDVQARRIEAGEAEKGTLHEAERE